MRYRAAGKRPRQYDTYLKEADLRGPEPLPPTRTYPEMPRATVSVAGVKESIEKAVREAVSAAGGLAEIERGQRVFIKPNITGPAIRGIYPGRITTHPEVLRAVIRLVKERGAFPIVGDRGIVMPELSFRTAGFARVCKEEGAQGFPFNRSEYEWFLPGKRHWSRGFRIPTILKEVDHFINVPVLKNHESTNAEYTCCLKSFVGVCHPKDRRQKGPDSLHKRNISEKIAELNLCEKPLMNVVDATTIMIRGGPGDGIMQGDPLNRVALWEQADLILAGRDRVACDSVALAVLKLYGAERQVGRKYVTRSVWDQVQIYYAAELGLGQADPEMITIENIEVGRFDEIKANWA
jgi:uncharacterized protein (DUF362 family)